ncbi:hypothetical protein OHS58_17995 [Amycolatopsis sp. NBC_00348]|uniref:hypothetical protein n=1 Tax=Amycolatopsis sp. NBC_00348 TaxID=2975956 RepID=UPI002E2609BA
MLRGTFGEAVDNRLKRWILDQLEVTDDRRVTRYRQLAATINGWPPLPDLEPVFTWFGKAPHSSRQLAPKSRGSHTDRLGPVKGGSRHKGEDIGASVPGRRATAETFVASWRHDVVEVLAV